MWVLLQLLAYTLESFFKFSNFVLEINEILFYFGIKFLEFLQSIEVWCPDYRTLTWSLSMFRCLMADLLLLFGYSCASWRSSWSWSLRFDYNSSFLAFSRSYLLWFVLLLLLWILPLLTICIFWLLCPWFSLPFLSTLLP